MNTFKLTIVLRNVKVHEPLFFILFSWSEIDVLIENQIEMEGTY